MISCSTPSCCACACPMGWTSASWRRGMRRWAGGRGRERGAGARALGLSPAAAQGPEGRHGDSHWKPTAARPRNPPLLQGEEAADIVLGALRPHMQRGWVLADRGGGWGGGGEGAVRRVRLADPHGFLVSNDIISDCFAAFDITSQAD